MKVKVIDFNPNITGLYKCVGVTTVKKPKVAGLNPAIRHKFYLISDTHKPFLFFNTKKQAFSDKV